MTAIALTLTGCATTDEVMKREVAVKEREAKLMNMESSLKREQDALAKREMALKDSKKMEMSADSSLFPPESKPGHCYARVMIPAKYVSKTEKVLKKQAGTRIETVPAKFAPAEERILVKEESSKIEVVPATYKTVTEKLMIKPASTKLVEVAATYKTVSEKVLEKAAHTIWKRGSDSMNNAVQTRIDEDSGEIMCLVEVPATYKTITKRVIDTPATTRTVNIPAEYETVSRRVVDKPATTRTVKIPAEWKTVKTQKLVTKASEKVIKIPAEFQTVTKREKVSEEKIVWREVLCEVNLTAANVRSIQNGLKSVGLYSGDTHGRLDSATMSAVQKYAQKEGLPTGNNYISVQTARRLGVSM